jgi:hypothetical protein
MRASYTPEEMVSLTALCRAVRSVEMGLYLRVEALLADLEQAASRSHPAGVPPELRSGLNKLAAEDEGAVLRWSNRATRMRLSHRACGSGIARLEQRSRIPSTALGVTPSA